MMNAKDGGRRLLLEGANSLNGKDRKVKARKVLERSRKRFQRTRLC